METPETIWRSRASWRQITARGIGDSDEFPNCPFCGRKIKFQSKAQLKKSQLAEQPGKVICNVYKGGKFVDVYHYHELCYAKAKQPHGKVTYPESCAKTAPPKKPAVRTKRQPASPVRQSKKRGSRVQSRM